ncbi:MAG: nucleoside monophosphate kinase [Clostridia bacterium]|nr:nucleoside monophosphate kinase [Clostridia bacterium]
MIYVMLGGPATGKGTRSDILSEALNIPHISTGDILRQVSRKDEEVKELLAEGELIPDEVITKLLYARLSMTDCENGAIIDGYPRTLEQAVILDEILAKLGKKVDIAIELIAPDDLVYKRILERKKCTKCGKMYGIDFPPKSENVCDECGGKLEVRADDTEETLKNRIEIYKENEKPIIEYYTLKGVLRVLDSSGHPENIIKEVE